MDDPLCRVSIQCADAARAVDVALPRHAALGVLLPDIVGLVTADVGSAPDAAAPRGWRLDRICGGRCDESMSLHESGIVDGDVIVLSPWAAPPPGPLPQNVFRAVATADARPEASVAPAAAWAGACTVAAVALGYSGAADPTPVVVFLAAAASVACVLIARRSATAMRLTLHGAAIGFGCITGFLAVPAPAGMPGVVLGAAVGCAVSVWLLRTCGADVRFGTATATALALLTAVGAPRLLLPAGLGSHGAVLGVLSLGVLTVAGRLAIGLAGPRPRLPGRSDDTGPVSDDAAVRGRAVFTGVVAGSSVAAALAVGMLALGSRGSPSWPQAVALAAVISALLLLRVRFYADPACRSAAGWCGLLGAAATVALATVSVPRYGGPAAVLALAGWCYAGRAARAPSWSRTVDIAEYLLMAAVVPLACWVAGLYQVVRSLSLG
ncbi:type VII secretion integral membrane protein EccD [Mycobacterium sp. AMU20-3851]|uniref:type VII secretion integral membrane protein EccD n=1 Tax=Mycobacterium sp. AMU20-3851 TaxID=3122055 RepID=UPI0037543ADE